MHNIGLVGVGRWAEKIVRTISELSNEARLVTICQRTPKEISWLPKDCIVYDNIDDMLNKSTLTHIITAIDPDGHYDVVKKATKYEIPVWLEKPMALSLAETNRIFALNGSIFVDYIHLYSECFEFLLKEVKNTITSKSTIRSVLHSEPYHTFPMLYNFASHDLSMLFDVFNKIQITNIHITNRYLYDGMIQKLFKNDDKIFTAKELPLKHAIRAFLSGERVNKEKTVKITKLLDEIYERTNIV